MQDGRPAKRQRRAPLELDHHASDSRNSNATTSRPAAQGKPKPVKTKFNELLGGDVLKVILANHRLPHVFGVQPSFVKAVSADISGLER